MHFYRTFSETCLNTSDVPLQLTSLQSTAHTYNESYQISLYRSPCFFVPSFQPTEAPVYVPSGIPIAKPTFSPSKSPTRGPTRSPTKVVTSSSSNKNSLSAGAIAGIVIGCVAFAGILTGVAVFFYSQQGVIVAGSAATKTAAAGVEITRNPVTSTHTL